MELLEIIWYVPSGPVPGYSYGYRIPGIPKKSELKCYSENAGILGILGFYLPEQQHEINFYWYSPTPLDVLKKL